MIGGESMCPKCNSINVKPSVYKGWLKCEDCLHIFD